MEPGQELGDTHTSQDFPEEGFRDPFRNIEDFVVEMRSNSKVLRDRVASMVTKQESDLERREVIQTLHDEGSPQLIFAPDPENSHLITKHLADGFSTPGGLRSVLDRAVEIVGYSESVRLRINALHDRIEGIHPDSFIRLVDYLGGANVDDVIARTLGDNDRLLRRLGTDGTPTFASPEKVKLSRVEFSMTGQVLRNRSFKAWYLGSILPSGLYSSPDYRGMVYLRPNDSTDEYINDSDVADLLTDILPSFVENELIIRMFDEDGKPFTPMIEDTVFGRTRISFVTTDGFYILGLLHVVRSGSPRVYMDNVRLLSTSVARYLGEVDHFKTQLKRGFDTNADIATTGSKLSLNILQAALSRLASSMRRGRVEFLPVTMIGAQTTFLWLSIDGKTEWVELLTDLHRVYIEIDELEDEDRFEGLDRIITYYKFNITTLLLIIYLKVHKTLPVHFNPDNYNEDNLEWVVYASQVAGDMMGGDRITISQVIEYVLAFSQFHPFFDDVLRLGSDPQSLVDRFTDTVRFFFNIINT